MGRKKYAAKIRNQRENLKFDRFEEDISDENATKPMIKNAPTTIYAHASKKAKRKAKKNFLKQSAISKTLEMTDTAMDEVVIPTKFVDFGLGLLHLYYPTYFQGHEQRLAQSYPRERGQI